MRKLNLDEILVFVWLGLLAAMAMSTGLKMAAVILALQVGGIGLIILFGQLCKNKN